MEKPEETVAIDEPMAVEAGDRDVRISIAHDGVLTLTADAAEISGLRLLDAAQKARSGAKQTD